MTLHEALARLDDTGFLLGAGRRKKAIRALLEAPDGAGMEPLAKALGRDHPDAKRIAAALSALSVDEEADKVRALWSAFVVNPQPPVGSCLAKVGWPPDAPVEERLSRRVLELAGADAAPEVLGALVAFARALPVADEALNDAIYAAWLRSQSLELEKLIADQHRQPATPALEALHTLVTGRLDRYAALEDKDGALLVQAFGMAPEPFRQRIARSVQANGDRGLLQAYRRAQDASGMDPAQRVENLKRLGDDDGLFEATRSMRMLDVLPLCEHWARSQSRPSADRPRLVVESAVETFIALGQVEIEPGPELPDGLVDIFDYWRQENPSKEQLAEDLEAEDPFEKARGLYLGHEQGLVDQQRLRQAAGSDHWPGRLIARMLNPDVARDAKEDHVIWVNAVAGDASLLHAPIECGPDEYTRNSERLAQARGLLKILCAFQGAFVAGGLVLDEIDEADDRAAVELEDADDVQF